MIHNVTKKKKIVNKLCKLGVSVSFDRVQEVSATITNALCAKYNQDGVVCPHPISSDIFVTAAIDNIDHNQSSNTASNSFHGSSVTVIQHPRTAAGIQVTEHANIEEWSRAINSNLPISYTNVPPLGKVVEDTSLHTVVLTSFEDTTFNLDQWLSTAREIITNDEVDGHWQDHISFAAFHCARCSQREVLKSYSTLLPLFHQEIASPAMVKHLMDIVMAATSKLNKDQTPVFTGDQPVYTISRQIQWHFRNTHGEDNVMVMMGALHIEMMVLNILGNSRWTDVLVNAGVTSVGVAETCLTASHAKRAHEVSIVTLSSLQELAYSKYCEESPDKCTVEKEEWKKKRVLECPQFHYWNNVIELESLLMQVVFSIRTANFKLHVVTLKSICPWTFALDAVHYSCWLPVFVRDLEELPQRHPGVYAEFIQGRFTSNRTTSPFSSMSDDQFHEQNNKMIKSDCGTIGIFDNESALTKWMVAVPDIARIITEFEDVASIGSQSTLHESHHEDTRAFEKRVRTYARQMISGTSEEGNPFESNQLVSIGSRKLIATEESGQN